MQQFLGILVGSTLGQYNDFFSEKLQEVESMQTWTWKHHSALVTVAKSLFLVLVQLRERNKLHLSA